MQKDLADISAQVEEMLAAVGYPEVELTDHTDDDALNSDGIVNHARICEILAQEVRLFRAQPGYAQFITLTFDTAPPDDPYLLHHPEPAMNTGVALSQYWREWRGQTPSPACEIAEPPQREDFEAFLDWLCQEHGYTYGVVGDSMWQPDLARQPHTEETNTVKPT